MRDAPPLPSVPEPAVWLLGMLPLAPLSFAAQRVADQIARRCPDLFDRLGPYAGRRYLIDPTDLPVVIVVKPDRRRTEVAVMPRGRAAACEARLVGRFAAFLAMLHGTCDGDALFFSGDIAIEGDTEAILALRNALDNAEIDLVGALLASLGPLGSLIAPPARLLAAAGERLTGFALTRRPTAP